VFPTQTKQSLGIVGQEVHTTRENFHNKAKKLVRLSVVNVTLASYKASTLALAAIKTSMHLVSLQGARTKDQNALDRAKARAKHDLLRFDLDIDSEEVQQCVNLMLMFYQDQAPEHVVRNNCLGQIVCVTPRPEGPVTPLAAFK
jgi:hypothetical protein